MAPENDCRLWRSSVTLARVCLGVVRIKGWLEPTHKRIRNRGRVHPNSTRSADRIWERPSQRSRLGTLSLANAMLNTALSLPTWITLLINSRMYGSLSPGSYLHIFLALTAPSTSLHMADANYWTEFTGRQERVSLTALGQVGTYGRGYRWNGSNKLTNSSAPSLQWHIVRILKKKWTKSSPLNFFWRMMKSPNTFYTCGFWLSYSIGNYGTGVKTVFVKTNLYPHGLSLLLAGGPCHAA